MVPPQQLAEPSPIIVTAGEPAGIGPDVVLAYALSQTSKPAPQPWLTIGNPALFAERANQLNLTINIVETSPEQCPTLFQSLAHQQPSAPFLPILPTPLQTAAIAGTLNPDNSSYVVETLTCATQLCLEGRTSAMVTAPVHKGIINEAGIPFTGHTELLADLTGTEQVVMMLASDTFRVALVTTHLPLREVPDAITADRLMRVIRILHEDLIEKFGIDNPLIRVCGLNPHAGEQGHMGREEIDIINPVLRSLHEQGLNVDGAYPADTLFTPHYLPTTDAFLAMYHDQGLPVLKNAGFGRAVNITLGLPIIRTSVDHGTALEIAGSGQAKAGSLIAAMEMAQQMAAKRLSRNTTNTTEVHSH